MAAATGQHFYDASLHRVKGEVILADDRQLHGLPSKAAEDEFRQALEIARAQQTKAFELQAAVSLTRLLLGEHRQNEAQVCLGPIFSSFTEGFGTRDLRDARKLLAEIEI